MFLIISSQVKQVLLHDLSTILPQFLPTHHPFMILLLLLLCSTPFTCKLEEAQLQGALNLGHRKLSYIASDHLVWYYPHWVEIAPQGFRQPYLEITGIEPGTLQLKHVLGHWAVTLPNLSREWTAALLLLASAWQCCLTKMLLHIAGFPYCPSC